MCVCCVFVVVLGGIFVVVVVVCLLFPKRGRGMGASLVGET